MKTLQDFTPEIEAKIPEYQKWALEGVKDGGRYRSFDYEKAKQAVYYNYEYCGYQKPIVLVAENPLEQQIIFNYLKKHYTDETIDEQVILKDLEKNLYNKKNFKMTKEMTEYHSSYLFTLSVYSDAVYTWYKFIKEEFKLDLDEKTNKLFEEIFHLQRESGVYSCVFAEKVAIVCKYPLKVHQLPETFNLHNVNGNSVEWAYKFMPFDCYYVNGRNVPKDIYEKIDTITFNEFQKLQNEEDKAAIVTIKKERYGNQELLKFLDAELIDERTIVHENSMEIQRLYKTKKKFSWANDSKGNSNVQLAWNEMMCPSTGQTYLIETCPTFNSVVESCKFLRPSFIPADLDYSWVSAN
jgi:hypothetical protein